MTNESKALDGFYQFCLTTCSPTRLKKIQWIMVKSKGMINKDLTRLSVDDVVKFLAALNQSDFAQWSKNDFKKIFKRFLKWYYKDLELIEGDKVKQGFKGASKKRAFNKEKINKNTLVKKEELEALIRAASSLKWKALISFTYESGFRPCEIRLLKWKDLRFDDGLNICRARTLSPKTKQDREVPVRDCIVHLKRWRDEYQFINRNDNDFVFPSQNKRDKPMGQGVVSQMVLRLCEKAKIRHVYPYLIRHTRITEVQKRLPEKIAAKFGGHSVETSEIYNHLEDDDVEESMLKEIYVTEELSPEEKDQLKKKIEKQEKVIESLREHQREELKLFKEQMRKEFMQLMAKASQ